MVTIEHDLYVVVSEMKGEHAPLPKPLPNGFSENIAYRVLGLHSASETSEAYLILVNDNKELWFISNRHMRAHGLFPGRTQLNFSIDATADASPLRIARSPESAGL
jgi:hypothetical protein